MKSYKSRRALMTIVLSLIMILGAATSAFAASVTIEKNDGQPDGAEYTYYNVFNDLSGFFGTDEAYSINADGEIVDNSDNSVVTTDGNVKVNNTSASKLASALQQYVITEKIAGTVIEAKEGVVKADGLEEGFYLIRETATPAGDDQVGAIASNPILVNLKGDNANQTIHPKDDKITLEKKIKEDDTLKDTNSAAIGDEIPYLVTSKIPTYEADVIEGSLKYTFTDTFDAGLTYQNNIVVKVNGTVLEVTPEYNESARTLTVALTPAQILANQGANITLEYSAVLNENAKFDDTEGNVNSVKLEYTNNPNLDGNAKYTELDDDVTTYSFGFDLKKVDAQNITDDLAGAEFEITDEDGNAIATVTYNDKGEPVVNSNESATVITSVEGDTVKVDGLKGGTYTIHETKAPEGYSLIAEDIKLTITPGTEKDENGDVKRDKDGNDVLDGTAEYTVSGGNNPSAEVVQDEENPSSFEIVVTVKDYKGVNLPETGRNTALYCMIGGGALVVLGGLYYAISRRRNNA